MSSSSTLAKIDDLISKLDEILSADDEKGEYVASQIRIKALPGAEIPKIAKHFEIVNNVKLPSLGPNQLLIETEYLSVDPYQRPSMKNWYPAQNKQMQGFQTAKVIESNDDKYKKGDFIYGHFPWSTKNIIDSKAVQSKIPPDLSDYDCADEKDEKFDITQIDKLIPHSYYIGSYGMPGMTAYYGMIYRGQIKKGENVLISGAAGAVGSICGQIAKQIYGCYVVGICGTKQKMEWLKNDLSFDAVLNYKDFGDDTMRAQKALKECFPNGIDLYFDNTGGTVTNATWDLLNTNARAIVCGQISRYNADNTQQILRPMLHKLIYKEIDIRGIMVGFFKDKKKFYYDMAKWMSSGKIKVKETVIDGFNKAPEAFLGLFSGRNIGKMVVKCT